MTAEKRGPLEISDADSGGLLGGHASHRGEGISEPRFSLRQLWYFIAVADTGSLKAAAGQLHVSPSAVSQAVAELERATGTQICVRRKAHGVTLTAAGLDVLRRARVLIRDAAELTAGLGGPSLAGQLWLGCFLPLAGVLLPRLLAPFGERHPQVEVLFVEDTADRLHYKLSAGEIELALFYDLAVPAEIEFTELFPARPHVILPAGHRLASAPDGRVSLRDLQDEPMVLYEATPGRAHTMQLCAQAGIRPSVRYTTGSLETARALVAAGLGWAMLIQRTSVDRTFDGLRIVQCEITELSNYSIPVCIGWAARARLTRQAEAFVAHALAALGPAA